MKVFLSSAQLEVVSRAGQCHSQTLPNGETRGFFCGDGTGVGKGRTVAGIILDNFNQGRKRLFDFKRTRLVKRYSLIIPKMYLAEMIW